MTILHENPEPAMSDQKPAEGAPLRVVIEMTVSGKRWPYQRPYPLDPRLTVVAIERAIQAAMDSFGGAGCDYYEKDTGAVVHVASAARINVRVEVA